MNELTTEKTMTTKELAEALGVDKSTISRTLETLPDLVATLQQVNINGKMGYVYNEAQATAIKTALQNKTKISKNGFDTLTIANDFEMLVMQQKLTEYQSRRIAELQAENERKEKQLIEQKPKVDFYDRVTESSDCIDIGQCAKVLNVKNIGRNKLFEILRQKKILNEHNQPYQKYVDCGYFRIIETSFNLPDGTQKINLKTVVFQKGVDFIRRTVAIDNTKNDIM
jgi:phage antirepressor YoqD-like protein